MKRILAFSLLLFLAVPLFAEPQAAPLDTDWPVLAAQVKDGSITVDEANLQAKAVHEAVAKGQELNRAGKYLEAVEATSLSHCKAWYMLNALRQQMGMVLNPDTHEWEPGEYIKTTETGVTTYEGDNLVECLKELNMVKGFIKAARESKVPGPASGPNTMDNCEAYVLKYEKYLKQ